jgi:hypothetical protein
MTAGVPRPAWDRGCRLKVEGCRFFSPAGCRLVLRSLARRRIPPCLSSCSQMRTTRQPARRNARLTRRSRARFAANFFRQNAALPFGFVPCFGQPCQKQPSTKSASRTCRKTKSGRTRKVGRRCCAAATLGPRSNAALPRISTCRRHPVMPCARNNRTSASSVSRLPRERMRDITSLRFALVKTSGIDTNYTNLHEFVTSSAIRVANHGPVLRSFSEGGWTRIQFAARELTECKGILLHF